MSPRLVLGGALLLGAIALIGASIGGPSSAATEASTRSELAVGPADAVTPSKGPEVPLPNGGVAPTIRPTDTTPAAEAREPAGATTDALVPTTPSDTVAPNTLAPDTVAPTPLAPDTVAPTKTTDDRVAAAPDDQSAPVTVIKRTAKIAEHLTPRCEQLREQTRVARDAYRWKTVLELASERRCWARSADARKLETQARMESGDFAGCVAASSGLEEFQVARWRDLCKKRGGLG